MELLINTEKEPYLKIKKINHLQRFPFRLIPYTTTEKWEAIHIVYNHCGTLRSYAYMAL